MTLKIISAMETMYEGRVKQVTLPGTMGAFTVLKNHASLISTLTKGRIDYIPEDSAASQSVEVAGGLADIDNNVISVCVY